MSEWGKWITGSYFSVAWFDILLVAVLALQIGLIFARNDKLHLALTVLAVAGELGLIAACLYLQATLTELLLILAIVAFVSCISCKIEYKKFDQKDEVVRCAELAERAKARAEDLEYRFVAPLYGEKAAKPVAVAPKVEVSVVEDPVEAKDEPTDVSDEQTEEKGEETEQ